MSCTKVHDPVGMTSTLCEFLRTRLRALQRSEESVTSDDCTGSRPALCACDLFGGFEKGGERGQTVHLELLPSDTVKKASQPRLGLRGSVV